MAAVSKSYGIGDTVYVWYHDSITLQYTPQERTVQNVDVTTSGNQAEVYFTDGDKVTDGSTARVFTTEAACATAIVDAVIANTDLLATIALDTTVSDTSVGGSTTTALCRYAAS